MTSTNAGWEYTKSLTIGEDAVVTVNATIKGGGAPGRSGSYDYLKVGGVSFRVNEQDKTTMVDVDGTTTTIATGVNRNIDHTLYAKINTETGAVEYTMDGVFGTASSTTTINSVAFGHYKAGRED